jgi:hypothetical protein
VVLRYLVICVLLACATACGGSDTTRGPAAPTTVSTPPPAPPPPPPGEVTYTVLDGWTREPVPGAVVNANGEQTRTDAAGHVRLFTTPPHCLRVQVLALGFLERSTCALPEITLWPIVNSDDREATRIAAFGYGDSITTTGRMMPIGVNLGAYRPDVLRVWRAAADEIRELTSGGVIFSFDVVGFAEGTILVTPGSVDACAKSNLKPTETLGFCWDPRYWGDGYIVLQDRFEDLVVARRVLASVLIYPHPTPGVMNQSQPSHEFSTFERKTLRMIGQRPGYVRWPDFDQF